MGSMITANYDSETDQIIDASPRLNNGVANSSIPVTAIPSDQGNIFAFGNLGLTGLPDPIPGAFSVAVSGAGGLSGTYQYRIHYKNVSGVTQSPGSTAITASGNSVLLTLNGAVPVGVTSVEVYRSVANEPEVNNCYFLASLPIGTTTYLDNIADGALGTLCPFVNSTVGGFSANGTKAARLGSFTTIFGYRAMEVGYGGYACTAYGSYALKSNTSGLRNTAIGVDALIENTTGSRNTAVGVHAADANVSGNSITAVGYAALFKSLAGGNTAVGANALENATGGPNDAFGYLALNMLTTGTNNVAVGQNSKRTTTTGSQSVAIGGYSQEYCNGNFSVSIGFYSMRNPSSNFSTAVGYESLNSNTAGERCVALGAYAGKYASGNNQIFIDAFDRGSSAGEKSACLIYGETHPTSPQLQRVNINAVTRHYVGTVATLPAAGATFLGCRAFVTDATSNTFGGVVAGGGSVSVPVYCDGVAWRIG